MNEQRKRLPLKADFYLTFDNFIPIYDVISRYSTEAAVEQCFAFLDANAYDLVNSNEVFSQLPHGVVQKLMSRETFKVDEWRKCKALIQWQSKNEAFDVIELVKPLKWNKISVADFKTHILSLNAISASQFVELVPSNSNSIIGNTQETNNSRDRDSTPVSDIEEPSTPSDHAVKKEPASIKQERKSFVTIIDFKRALESGRVQQPIAGPSNESHDFDVDEEGEEEFEDDDEDDMECISYTGSGLVSRFLKQEFIDDDISDSDLNEMTDHVYDKHFFSVENGAVSGEESPRTGKKRRTMWYNENTIKHLQEVNEKESKKFVCSICGKQFGQSNSALRHIAVVHFNAKQFPCELCGKHFSQLSNLKQHVESIHVAVYCFICEVDNCGRRFKSQNQLNQHRKIVHEKRELCECDVCHRPFSTRKGLNNHKKTKHGFNDSAVSLN